MSAKMPGASYPEVLRAAFTGLVFEISPALSGRPARERPFVTEELSHLASAAEADPDLIGDLYESCLAYLPAPGGGFALEPQRGGRKSSGAFYTPAPFVERLVDAGLARGPGVPFVCDPACGCGRFLLQAFRRLKGRAAAEAVLPHLCGVDADPLAAWLCRVSLCIEAGVDDPSACNVHCADSLTADWNRLFPAAAAAGGFDAVVGNPPFGNVVEGRVPGYVKAMRGERFPELGGMADLAFYFASLACRIVKPGGRVALVQPRTFLSAPSCAGLRLAPPNGMVLEILDVPARHDSFAGAAVFVCLVAFRGPASGESSSVLESPDVSSCEPFEVRQSMTVSEAYHLRDSVADVGNVRFVTTGLIDPDECLWGTRRCRFLGRDYAHPSLDLASLPESRARLASRPKLLLAGLCARLEGFLDADGSYAGAVSTYAITHEADDVACLRGLLDHLMSSSSSDEFRKRLGPSALGGGNITVTKRFLKELVASYARSR